MKLYLAFPMVVIAMTAKRATAANTELNLSSITDATQSFKIKARDMNVLCLGLKNGSLVFSACADNHLDQTWTFDPATHRVHSGSDDTKCISIDASGSSPPTLETCSTDASQTSWNAASAGLLQSGNRCFEVTLTMAAGNAACDPSKASFQQLVMETVSAPVHFPNEFDLTKIIDPFQQFKIENPGTQKCFEFDWDHDYAANSKAYFPFPRACNDNTTQLFTYDPSTKLIHSVFNSNYCLGSFIAVPTSSDFIAQQVWRDRSMFMEACDSTNAFQTSWNTARSGVIQNGDLCMEVKPNYYGALMPLPEVCDNQNPNQGFGMHIMPSNAPTGTPTMFIPGDDPQTDAPSVAPTSAPGPVNHNVQSPSNIKQNQTAVTATSHGDPHFKTWSGFKFDFHGGCDLVLVDVPDFENPSGKFEDSYGLTVHIRTKIKNWWSYIATAVVQIGPDVLEVTGGNHGRGEYWINGVPGSTLEKGADGLEFMFAGFHGKATPVSDHKRRYRIDLNRGGAISLEHSRDFVRVNINVRNQKWFLGAKGMMGSFPGGMLIARDGVTVLNDDPNAFGQEWQVLPTEPKLFRTVEGPQAPNKCIMPDAIERAATKRRRLGESIIDEETAALACKDAAEDEVDACIFDVLATNTKEAAGAY